MQRHNIDVVAAGGRFVQYGLAISRLAQIRVARQIEGVFYSSKTANWGEMF
jgi:hypothetical protein